MGKKQCCKESDVIVVQGSIQEAVNRAKPGDTIRIPPGVYKGFSNSQVIVNIPPNLTNLTIIGEPGAVIDATGAQIGILSSPVPYDTQLPDIFIVPELQCPGLGITGLTIQGVKIINASWYGLFVVGADCFKFSQITTENCTTYGIFPVCSRNGIIEYCTVSGSLKDAGIYVGISVNVSVRHNIVTNNLLGIEFENSINCDGQYNDTNNNTVGILVDIGPNIPIKENSMILLAHNKVHDNIRPGINPDSTNPNAIIDPNLTPTGITISGGGPVVIFENEIFNNGTAGIVAIDLPDSYFKGPNAHDPGIGANGFVHGITVTRNLMFNNSNGTLDFIFASNGPIASELCFDNTNILKSTNGSTPTGALSSGVMTEPNFKDSQTVAPPFNILTPQTIPCPLPDWAEKLLVKEAKRNKKELVKIDLGKGCSVGISLPSCN